MHSPIALKLTHADTCSPRSSFLHPLRQTPELSFCSHPQSTAGGDLTSLLSDHHQSSCSSAEAEEQGYQLSVLPGMDEE